MPISDPDHNTVSATPSITLRGVVLGLATTVGVILYVIYVSERSGVGHFVHSQLPLLALMPFVLWIFLNVGFSRIWPSQTLKTGELLTILSMLWIVGTLPHWLGRWSLMVASPTHFASPENMYAEHFFDYLPWHVLAPTSARVLDSFWLGLPDGAPVPWEGWTEITLQWLGVSLAMVAFGYCLFVLFQTQWEDREKLAFPLAQLPLDLLRGMDGRRRLPDLFRTKLFWIGFGLVFVPILYNISTYFTMAMILPFNTEIFRFEVSDWIYRINIRYMPLVMAVTYLCPMDILGSLILFRIMSLFKAGMLTRTGISFGAEGQQIGGERLLFMENYGALMFIALWAIWIARGHLRETWRMAFRVRDDTHLRRRYRFAWIGLVLSAAYVVAWAMSLGMSLALALGSFLLMSLTFFVTTKLVAACGFAYLAPYRPFVKGAPFVVDLLGTAPITARGLAGFHLFTSPGFFGGNLIPAWPALTHCLRFFSLRHQPLAVTLVTLGVFALVFVVTVAARVDTTYRGGGTGISFEWWMTARFFDPLVYMLQNRTVMDWQKIGVFLFGWLQAAGMTYLRSRYHWFSLHPVGLAFQESFWLDLYWINLAVVWGVKATLLRYGGVAAYVAGKPFFYGMGVGYIVGVASSVLVDLIWFPTAGHTAAGPRGVG